MTSPRRIGLLTSGGDCPGLNAVIRAVTKAGANVSPSVEVVGILDGYGGLVEGRIKPLTDSDVSGILPRGGTILGTSNSDNPWEYYARGSDSPQDRSGDIPKFLKREGIDILITIGGDGTLRGAIRLSAMGVPILHIPKTIDNDIASTDVTFGFDSALAVATEAVDRLHTTAESHHRVLICEVMGRTAGWIALHAGIAGGGDVILIPEIPYSMDRICESIARRQKRGKRFSIMVVAEGAHALGGSMTGKPAAPQSATRKFRLGGVSHTIAEQIEERLHEEARVVILGHLQRGGTPTPFDRWLGTRYGTKAMEFAAAGITNRLVALRGEHVLPIPLDEIVTEARVVNLNHESIQSARLVGTSFGD